MLYRKYTQVSLKASHRFEFQKYLRHGRVAIISVVKKFQVTLGMYTGFFYNSGGENVVSVYLRPEKPADDSHTVFTDQYTLLSHGVVSTVSFRTHSYTRDALSPEMSCMKLYITFAVVGEYRTYKLTSK